MGTSFPLMVRLQHGTRKTRASPHCLLYGYASGILTMNFYYQWFFIMKGNFYIIKKVVSKAGFARLETHH